MRRNRGSFNLKYLHNITLVVFIIFLIYNFDEGSPSPAFAVEATGSAMEIEIVPDQGLFDVKNIAPGEKVTRRFTVKNKGQDSIKYKIASRLKEGSQLLYNNLNLVIKDSLNNIKYNGKLKDLNFISLGVMQPHRQSELDFTVEFPSESGNEYESLTSSFTLIIDAEQVLLDDSLGKPTSTPLIVGLPNTGGTPAQHKTRSFFTGELE